MKMNLGALLEKVEQEENDNDVKVKTKVWVSKIKPCTAKQCELLALEFKKFRLGLEK
jgi:hypothetical protein